MRPSCSLVALVPWLLAGCAGVPPAGDPAFLPAAPSDLVALGTVRVDRRNRSVIAEGWVNQVEGLVELLACGPEGKTHESILVLDADPVDLNAAFLLLGVRPGTPPRGLGIGAPRGEPVEVFVEWDVEGVPARMRGEELVLSRETSRELPRTPWIYTGLVGDGGTLMASLDKSLVATFWDPWALLNLPLPCGADDEILGAHTAVLPPLGTTVKVRFRPVKRP